jgi:hypothetical protein
MLVDDAARFHFVEVLGRVRGCRGAPIDEKESL